MDSPVNPPADRASETALQQWQRLSPIAILYFIVSTLKQSLQGFIYILPGLAIGYNHLKNNPLALAGFLVILFGLTGVSAILHFVFYRYRISGQRVEVKSGVLVKKHLDLPFSRIQNVTLEQPFFYRPFGYVALELDTAGSSSQEARVVALPMTLAESLKHEILKQHQVAAPADDEPDTLSNAGARPGEKELNRRSIWDLVIHGVTNNRVWILLGAMAPMFDNMGAGLNDYLKTQGVDLAANVSVEALAWWQLGAYAVTLALVLMALVALLSVIGAVIVFYGYTLSKTEDRYIRRSGLFTRQEVSMKLSRLQMVTRKQDWLDGLLGRINLHLEQNKTGQYENNGVTSSNIIVVPSVTPQQASALIRDAFEANRLDDAKFTPVNKRFILRFCLLMPMLCLPLLVFSLSQHNYGFATLIASVGVGWVGLIILRWFRWGVAFDEQFIYVRKGLFGVDYLCFPIDKVQQTALIQSVFMRRRQLASVRLVLASGSVSVPFLPEALARTLIDKTLLQVESRKQPWM